MMKWIRKLAVKLSWEWREENKLLVRGFKRQIKKFSSDERKILNKIIDTAEKLIEMFFNAELYGFYAIKNYAKEMSVAKFRKVYTVIFAYYLSLIETKKNHNQEYFRLLSETLEVDRYTFDKSLSSFQNITDFTELGRKSWAIIAEIIEYDERNSALPGVACGSFVIFSKVEWEKLEKLL